MKNRGSNTALNGARPVIAGTTTSPATNVTVNGVAAVLYADTTFAVTNVKGSVPEGVSPDFIWH